LYRKALAYLFLIFLRRFEMTAELRASTKKENPITQEELLKYAKENPEMLFDVLKVSISVDLKKAKGGENVHTVTLA